MALISPGMSIESIFEVVASIVKNSLTKIM
jgi:hypothetical protein